MHMLQYRFKTNLFQLYVYILTFSTEPNCKKWQLVVGNTYMNITVLFGTFLQPNQITTFGLISHSPFLQWNRF